MTHFLPRGQTPKPIQTVPPMRAKHSSLRASGPAVSFHPSHSVLKISFQQLIKSIKQSNKVTERSEDSETQMPCGGGLTWCTTQTRLRGLCLTSAVNENSDRSSCQVQEVREDALLQALCFLDSDALLHRLCVCKDKHTLVSSEENILVHVTQHQGLAQDETDRAWV